MTLDRRDLKADGNHPPDVGSLSQSDKNKMTAKPRDSEYQETQK
jgi:hypothetical protein